MPAGSLSQADLSQEFYHWSISYSRHFGFWNLDCISSVKSFTYYKCFKQTPALIPQDEVCNSWTKLALALGFATLSPREGWFLRPLWCLFYSLSWNTMLFPHKPFWLCSPFPGSYTCHECCHWRTIPGPWEFHRHSEQAWSCCAYNTTRAAQGHTGIMGWSTDFNPHMLMSCSLDQNKHFYKAMLTEGDFTAYCSYPELSWQLLVGERGDGCFSKAMCSFKCKVMMW